MPSPTFATSQAQLGYGSAFFTGAGSPITYTELSEVNSFSWNTGVTEVDVTNLASPNTTEESIPGMIRPGNIELTCNYISDASQQAIHTMMIARTVFPYIVTTPAPGGKTTTISGNGYFTRSDLGPMEPNKKIDYKITIRMSGAFTWTVA